MLGSSSHNGLLLLGRILFAAIFIFSGLGKILDFSSTVDYMQSAGAIFHPALLVGFAILFELGGGLSILLGWRIRLGAAAVFVFTLLASFMIHHFWTYSPEAAQMQMILFMKNMSILGGALFIFVTGAGAYSIDAKCHRQ